MIDTNALPGTVQILVYEDSTVVTLIDVSTGYTTDVDLAGSNEENVKSIAGAMVFLFSISAGAEEELSTRA